MGGEYPVHQVILSDYYIGKFEVTQELWEKVMGTTIEDLRWNYGSSYGLVGVGSDYPMYYVKWNEAVEFCEKLSQLTGKKYVLPTEAQWEYAARGGVKSKGYKYSGSNDIANVAWYRGNSNSSAHPVGTKQPNELGIYDMSGNVYEWTSDVFDFYSSDVQIDPTVQSSDYGGRVERGGSCKDEAKLCRVSNRQHDFGSLAGLRVVLLP